MILKSAWCENIQLETAHRHEVEKVGSESGSAMPCPCYRGVLDLNTFENADVYAIKTLFPHALRTPFDLEDRREILNTFKNVLADLRNARSYPVLTTPFITKMPPMANDNSTFCPI